MKRMTVVEFAENQGITNATANGVVNFLVEKGHAVKTDEARNALDENGKAKRGRPSVVYEFNDVVTVEL